MLESRYRTALELLGFIGVAVPPSGRHRKALSVLTDCNTSEMPINLADGKAVQEIEASHRTAWETYLIAFVAWRRTQKWNRGPETLFTRENFERLMKGPLVEEGENSDPRNIQYELHLGAQFDLAGYDVNGGEPDLRLLYGSEVAGIAAKRIRGASRTQVRNRVRDAVEQIRGVGLRGWIALNLDSRFGELKVGQPEDAKFAEFGKLFDEASPALQQQEGKPWVLGLIATGYTTAWLHAPGPNSPPKLHMEAPIRWYHWVDDPAGRLLFDEFTLGFRTRLHRNMQRMMDHDFRGVL